MKMNSIIKKTVLAISITGMFYTVAPAQDQPKATGKSEATIVLSYYKKADMSKTAVAIIKAKNEKGKFVPAKNAKVNFYAVQDKEQKLIQSANTDNKGTATIVLQKNLPLDENQAFTIVAKIENDNLYENTEEKMHFKEANLTLNLNPQDTNQVVSAKVMVTDKDGKEVPVKGAELKFYVKRMFGNMPAAEDYTVTTDENGLASYKFPKNIPGDTAGVITVAARMEDNDTFGNVENSSATSWGTPLAIIKDPFPRAVWGVYAPWGIVITLSILFGGVWSTYIFIVAQLIAIKKEGKEA